MGRTKRKKGKKSKKHGGLFGFTQTAKGNNAKDTAKISGGMLLATLAGGVLGAAIGKSSLLAGIPLLAYGAHKGNQYMMAAGLGLTVAPVIPTKTKSDSSSVNGFDFKELAQNAKDRIGQYFDSFKDKLYLSSSTTNDSTASGSATNGLQGNDEVKYFVHPYQEESLAEMERVGEQEIARANQAVFSFDDIDHEL
jgi:hypothetical protein